MRTKKKTKTRMKTKTTRTTTEIVSGDTIKLRVGMSVKITGGYQAVELNAGTEFDAKKEDRAVAYKKAWNLVKSELAANLPDAQQVLKDLIQSAN